MYPSSPTLSTSLRRRSTASAPSLPQGLPIPQSNSSGNFHSYDLGSGSVHDEESGLQWRMSLPGSESDIDGSLTNLVKPEASQADDVDVGSPVKRSGLGEALQKMFSVQSRGGSASLLGNLGASRQEMSYVPTGGSSNANYVATSASGPPVSILALPASASVPPVMDQDTHVTWHDEIRDTRERSVLDMIADEENNIGTPALPAPTVPPTTSPIPIPGPTMTIPVTAHPLASYQQPSSWTVQGSNQPPSTAPNYASAAMSYTFPASSTVPDSADVDDFASNGVAAGGSLPFRPRADSILTRRLHSHVPDISQTPPQFAGPQPILSGNSINPSAGQPYPMQTLRRADTLSQAVGYNAQVHQCLYCGAPMADENNDTYSVADAPSSYSLFGHTQDGLQQASLPRKPTVGFAHPCGHSTADFSTISRSASIAPDELMTGPRPSMSAASKAPTFFNGIKRWKSTATMFTGVNRTQKVRIRDFLMMLAKSFARYGAPSHRIEYQVELVAFTLEQPTSVAVIPGVMWISFGDEDHNSSCHLIKVSQGYNLNKLSLVNKLCYAMVHGEIDAASAVDELTDIANAPSYPDWYDCVTFPIVAFTICLVGFGGHWLDSGMAAALALIVGLLSYVSTKMSQLVHLIPFLAAFICSFLSRAVMILLAKDNSEGFCYNHVPIVLSAIVMLLPGLQITTAIIEISTRNMVSGTVRIFSGLFHATMLGFGISTGRSVVFWGDHVPDELSTHCGPAPSIFWNFLFFPPLCLAFIYNFQCHRRQFPHIASVSTLGWATYLCLSIPKIFQSSTGQIVPNIMAAFVIGCASNIYARVTKDVAVPAIWVGIVMMVPGSMGVRASLGFFGSNATDATQVVFQMLVVGMSLAIGLFAATVAIFPVKGPRYKYMTI